jgi:hypothetical protein
VWEGAGATGAAAPDDAADETTGPVPKHLADELACVARWLDARTASVRLVACEGTLAWPLPRLPRFDPVAR